MEVWSLKPTYYSISKALEYAYIKQDKLDARTVKCVFTGYPENVKGYKSWKLEYGGRSRVVISSDVSFDETQMRMKCKDMVTLVPKTRVEETQFEAELPIEEKENAEEQTPTSDSSGKQPAVDLDYQLARDRERKSLWHVEDMVILTWFVML